jgi:hypothetical protein
MTLLDRAVLWYIATMITQIYLAMPPVHPVHP